MKVQTLGTLTLLSVLTMAIAACSYAGNRVDASAETWGKTDFTELTWQSTGPRKMAPMWRSDDAHARVIQAPANHSWEHVVESDTKGVVIKGDLAHGETVLTTGAYWTQPGGSTELLRCAGTSDCIVYLESESTTGEISRTVITAADIPWFEVPDTYGNVFLAWVWGDAQSSDPSGFFLKFKAGFPGAPHTHTGSYNGVVLQGRYKHWEVADDQISVLPIGTPFWQVGGAPHDDACEAGQDCISYFRIDGQFDYFPHKPASEN